MKRLELTYSIVTPMFLGNADQKATSFRIPSLKGALRFWWRALVWNDLQREAGDGSLAALHAREARVFGTAAKENDSSQSRVLLSARAHAMGSMAVSEVVSAGAGRGQRPGIRYLLGQGMGERNAFRPGKVEVTATFRSGVSEEDRRDVERAFFALGLLGGLGSRNRRGFGSLALSSIEGDRLLECEPPARRAAFGPALQSVVGPLAGGEPPFTALSTQTRVDLSLTGAEALAALDAAGQRMATSRQGHRGDAQIADQVAKRQEPKRLPARIVFGLPLPFFFRKTGTTVVFDLSPKNDEKRDRRGSPLLLHTHHFADEDEASAFAVVQTLLPATFVPPGDSVRAKAKTKTQFLASLLFRPGKPTFQPIHAYLDGFAGETGFERISLS